MPRNGIESDTDGVHVAGGVVQNFLTLERDSNTNSILTLYQLDAT